MSFQESEAFMYLGLYVEQNDQVIRNYQIPYINELKECITKNSPKDMHFAKLTRIEVQQLRGLGK